MQMLVCNQNPVEHLLVTARPSRSESCRPALRWPCPSRGPVERFPAASGTFVAIHQNQSPLFFTLGGLISDRVSVEGVSGLWPDPRD